MNRFAAVLALACLLPSAAPADPPFQAPGRLPVPRGRHDLPTPHVRPLPVSYSLSCTLGTSPVTPGHLWHVRNEGPNTAPTGLHFHTQSGGFIHADFRLGRALAPGDAADFASPATPFDHPTTNRDACTVSYDR